MCTIITQYPHTPLGGVDHEASTLYIALTYYRQWVLVWKPPWHILRSVLCLPLFIIRCCHTHLPKYLQEDKTKRVKDFSINHCTTHLKLKHLVSPNFSPTFLHVGDFHSFKCTEYNVVSYLLHCIMYCYNVLTGGAALLITKFMTHLGIFPAEKSSRFRYPTCKLSLLVQSVLYMYHIHVAVKYITQC